MHIDPKQEIVGVPILTVRKILRKSFYWYPINPYTLKNGFHIPPRKISKLINALKELDYIKRDDQGDYYPTKKGSALRLASAAQPLTRSTANARLKTFLERCEELNRNPYYLYRVNRVALFGSMLTDVPRVGDIDLAVDLVGKNPDRKAFIAECLTRADEAQAKGRRFSNYVQHMAWGEEECLRFLKKRSRAIAIHTYSEEFLSKTNFTIVFEAAEKLS